MAGFLHHARANPEKPAFIFDDGAFVETYGALEARSRRIAHWLRARGMKPGCSVAMLLGNNDQFFDVYWATQRLGLFLTPLNWHLSTAELDYIVRNSDSDLLIASGDMGSAACNLQKSLGESVQSFVSIDGEIAGYVPLEPGLDLIDPGFPLEDQPAGSVMIYSSGTTGRPKGIRRELSGRRVDDAKHVQAVTQVLRTFGFNQQDRYLCPAPLYHAGPLRSCTAMQMLGGTVLAMRRFNAESALRIIQNQKVTVSQWVPTHFKRLLDLPVEKRTAFDLSSLRIAVHSAAPCPPMLKQQMIAWWGPILLEYYAATEGGGTMIDSHQWLQRPGSVGRTWSGLSVGVMNAAGEIVTTPTLEGPIYFRNDPGGLSNFHYHKDPDGTRKAYLGDWFTFGDIGYIDDEGFLFLTDRQANMIISGGVNIYPQETENVLMSHAKVHDVAVIGVPDDEMGEAVKALIVLKPGIKASVAIADELIAFSRDQIARFKAPRTIDFVDALPRTETGKLQKRILKELYRSDP